MRAWVLLLLLLSARAEAIRPFITDDARVVGRHMLQLESWVHASRVGVYHNLLPAFGPVEVLELTVGVVHGASFGEDGAARYALAGPLAQAKVLLHEGAPNRAPGVAVAGGVFPAVGFGGLEPWGTSGWLYLALTQSLLRDERLLIHTNIGLAVTHTEAGREQVTVTAGVGAQVRLVRGLHAVAELVHGDPYAGDIGGATQLGFRYVFNDHIAIDSTVGVGLWGNDPQPVWGTLGVRLVTSPLW